MKFTLYADGGARGNPGPAGAGAVVKDETGARVVEVSEFLGHATNNVAEYTAVLRALEGLAALLGDAARHAEVDVRLDSMLVVKQMTGEWKLKNAGLKPLNARVAELAQSFGKVSFAHVYREDNKEADALANAAMDRGA
jgi:ribonuclease HI